MREVVVTGIGLVSCARRGRRRASCGARGPICSPASTPKPSRPIRSIRSRRSNYDSQIAKKSDQRQMEPWQRLGCYAAGPRARRRRRQGRCGTQEPHAPHRGGRRRRARLCVDGQILTGLRTAADPGVFLNERLMGDLRPDALPGPALEPLGRQHLDRPRRHRRLAHLHGRGIERRRRDAHRAGAHRVGPERHLPRRRRLQRRAAGRAPHLRDGRLPLEEALSPGLRAAGGGRRHDPRVAAPASSCSNRANTRRRAAQSRSRRSPASPRTVHRRQPGSVCRPLDRLTAASSARRPTSSSPAPPASGRSPRRSAALAELAPGARPCDAATSSATPWRPGSGRRRARRGARSPEGKAGEALVTSVGHWRGEGAMRVDQGDVRRIRMALRDKQGRPLVAVTGMGVVTSLGQRQGGHLRGDDMPAAPGIHRITPLPDRGTAHHHRRHDRLSSRSSPSCAPMLSERLAMLAAEEAVGQSGLRRGRLPRRALHRGAAGRDGMAAARGARRSLRRERRRRDLRRPPQGRRDGPLQGLARPVHLRHGRRPGRRPLRHQRLADLALDRLLVRRDGDPARRRGDPPRRDRCGALHRHRRLGEPGIARSASRFFRRCRPRTIRPRAPRSPSRRTATAS